MPPTKTHYPVLDGLRGLAILLVVVYHNFGFINYFFFGWLGVDLFFVLSGFLITDILMKTVNRPHFLRNFYMRRVLRIFPLYYGSLILFLIILPACGILTAQLAYYRDNQWWLWTYLQNWLYIFKPTDANILHHFWSLAVEEQFYLIWPLTILLLRKPSRLFALLAVVLVAVVVLRIVVWNYQLEELAYFNFYTFSRIDGICIGSMLALLRTIRIDFLRNYTAPVVLSLALANFIFFFINRYYGYTFPFLAFVGYTTFAVMFALLVNEGVENKSRLLRLLFDNGMMKFFGRISYGLYVFHWPVFILTAPYFQDIFTPALPLAEARIAASITATLVGIGVSLISFRYFEQYFIRKKISYE
jgi:peptidoglycan/LPS O-acetylase OafA/YrhL